MGEKRKRGEEKKEKETTASHLLKNRKTVSSRSFGATE